MPEPNDRVRDRRADREQLEGDRPAGEQIIVIEFNSCDAARRWYTSAEYVGALEVRGEAMNRRLTLVGE